MADGGIHGVPFRIPWPQLGKKIKEKTNVPQTLSLIECQLCINIYYFSYVSMILSLLLRCVSTVHLCTDLQQRKHIFIRQSTLRQFIRFGLIIAKGRTGDMCNQDNYLMDLIGHTRVKFYCSKWMVTLSDKRYLT